jgi:hypothetical protein
LRYREQTTFDGSRSVWTMLIWRDELLPILSELGSELVYLDATHSTAEQALQLHTMGVVHPQSMEQQVLVVVDEEE